MELHYSLQYSVAVGFGLDLAEQINFFWRFGLLGFMENQIYLDFNW